MSKITALITTVRHGKKNSDGDLEDEGKIQSAHKAIDIEHLKGDIILFHSGEQRVKDTIAFIGGNIHKTSKEELEDFLNEKFDLQDYVVPTLHFLKNKNIKSDYFSGWQGEFNNENLEKFIGENTDFDDFERAYSAKEMAENLSRVIFTQIQFSSLTSDEYKTNFINGTHEPVIMSFLYYAMNNFNPKENVDEFISRVGGSVGYAEGFDVKVFQEGQKITKILLDFRGFSEELSLNSLELFLSRKQI